MHKGVRKYGRILSCSIPVLCILTVGAVLSTPAQAQTVCNSTLIIGFPNGDNLNRVVGQTVKMTLTVTNGPSQNGGLSDDQTFTTVHFFPACTSVSGGVCTPDPGAIAGAPPAIQYVGNLATSDCPSLPVANTADPFNIEFDFAPPFDFANTVGCTFSFDVTVAETGSDGTPANIAQLASTDGVCASTLTSQAQGTAAITLTCPPCNDGNVCNGTETCNPDTAQCVPGTPLSCDDGNACTNDSCNPATGCVHTTVSCDDSNACTNDSCNPATGCVHTTVSCDDSNACTNDSCNPATGCVHTSTGSCDDGNACTNDSCNPATGCVHTSIGSCDDGNACTNDSCNPATGCVHTSVSCDDGNACTNDSCNPATGCVHTPVSCDDSNVCTDDSCNPATGCVNTPKPPDFCNDNDQCTDDVCDPVDGCVHTPANPLPAGCGEAICRTPGFWGTHAGTEKAKSVNITEAVIDCADGNCADHTSGDFLLICGEKIDSPDSNPANGTTDVNDASSSTEAMCVSVKGAPIVQLARQLTAAALNCIMSGGGADCAGTSLYSAVFADCNATCASGTATKPELTACISELDCLNNGGSFTNGLCSPGGPGNCHERLLVNETLGLDFDPPGPAGSSNACNAANGTACTVVGPGEAHCGTDSLP